MNDLQNSSGHWDGDSLDWDRKVDSIKNNLAMDVTDYLGNYFGKLDGRI